MTPTLNTHQVEVNCRRIFYYGFEKLEADEYGTLHQPFVPGPIPYVNGDATLINLPGPIPLSDKRIKQIKPAVLATLEGVCLEMQKTLPICFFIIPIGKTVMYFV